jgi:PAS domain S-box-containing protein
MRSLKSVPQEPHLVQEVEPLFTAMAVEVPLPILITDQRGRIVFANKCAEQLLGYTHEEFIGQTPYLRDLCAPYESERYVFSILSGIKKTIYVDLDIKKRGGQVFMANTSFSPFVYNGSPYIFLTLRDVTKIRVQEGKTREDEERYRQLLAERNKLQAELNQSSKLVFMGELAAGIAHEINNPLGIILGFVQDMLDEISEENPLYEPIKIIEHETARCADVVRELLDFARLKPPQRSRVDLLQLLEDSVFLLIPQIRKNDLTITRRYEKNIPEVEIDPGLVQQVFLNVMLNAIQSMTGGGTLGLEMALEEKKNSDKEEKWVRVTVWDTGHGISEKNLGRVFDPFFTTKGSKGTGLGLPVCRRIMDDHRGRIELESQEGIGTRCNMYLAA